MNERKCEREMWAEKKQNVNKTHRNVYFHWDYHGLLAFKFQRSILTSLMFINQTPGVGVQVLSTMIKISHGV